MGQAFVQITDPVEAKNLCELAAQGSAPAVLWVKNQEWSAKSRIQEIDYESKRVSVELPIGLVARDFLESISVSGEGAVYVSVQLKRGSLFFRAEVRGIDPKGIQLKLPQEIFKVQRRKDLRYTVPVSHILYVEFETSATPGVRSKRKIMDLSAGGLAFWSPESDEGFFEVGQVLMALELKIRDRVIQGEVEVVSVARHLGRGAHRSGIRIGARWRALPEQVAETISRFVLEEAQSAFRGVGV